MKFSMKYFHRANLQFAFSRKIYVKSSLTPQALPAKKASAYFKEKQINLD